MRDDSDLRREARKPPTSSDVRTSSTVCSRSSVATLSGRRVLDLGCNAGYWSLQAINAGADFVLGVDGRQMHIDQAELVFGAKGHQARSLQIRAREHSLSTASKSGSNVVFCLGLMYHIAKPMELFELMAGVGAEILVIDTVRSCPSRGAISRYAPVSP